MLNQWKCKGFTHHSYYKFKVIVFQYFTLRSFTSSSFGQNFIRFSTWSASRSVSSSESTAAYPRIYKRNRIITKLIWYKNGEFFNTLPHMWTGVNIGFTHVKQRSIIDWDMIITKSMYNKNRVFQQFQLYN